jgi:hypothetical protein
VRYFVDELGIFTNGGSCDRLDRSSLLIEIQGVLSLLPWHTRHVRGLPYEDIPVCTEEGVERVFLCRVETYPDQGCLARGIVPKDDGLGLDIRLKLGLGSRVLLGTGMSSRESALAESATRIMFWECSSAVAVLMFSLSQRCEVFTSLTMERTTSMQAS